MDVPLIALSSEELATVSSFLTLPVKGKMYSTAYQPGDLPVAITFMGQFIDHDLTKNATNLVEPELHRIENIASPYIDLDSVYGPRQKPDNLVPPMTTDGNGKFILTKLDNSNNAYDVPRKAGTAQIPDGRNDENQLILQVHLLLMRVHNLLIEKKKLDHDAAQRETIFNWQSVVLNDHQASVLDPTIHEEVIQDLLAELAHPGHGPVRYRPNPVTRKLELPHEFAIGFRYGHSQLRDAYTVSPGKTFKLFDNLLPEPDFSDLRGGRPLTRDRVIDWSFFITPDKDATRSNRLDTLIASDVFNLPQSAVPDMPTNFLGNLPQQNLIRSHEIHLTSGEQLFDIFLGRTRPANSHPLELNRMRPSRRGTALDGTRARQ